MADITDFWSDNADGSESVVYPVSRVRLPICRVDEEREAENDSDGAGETTPYVRVAEEGTLKVH